jgi:3-(3-hydroxy-phenyl)propionate hydroxylase
MSELYDVAIVGYGPAGESLANFLGMQGVSTIVLEREPTVYAKPRVGGFCGDTMRSYQAIGVADDLLPDLIRATKFEFVDEHGKIVFSEVVAESDEPGPHGWSPLYLTYQPDIDHAMRGAAERYACVEIRLEHAVTAVWQDADEVVLEVNDLHHAAGPNEPQYVRARYVVGCEGGVP